MIKRGGLSKKQVFFIIICCVLFQFLRINIHELMQVKAFENHNISSCYTIDFSNGLSNSSFVTESDLLRYNNLSHKEKQNILYSGLKADFVFNIILLVFLFFYAEKMKDKRLTTKNDFIIISIIVITIIITLLFNWNGFFSKKGVNNLLLTNQNLSFSQTCLN